MQISRNGRAIMKETKFRAIYSAAIYGLVACALLRAFVGSAIAQELPKNLLLKCEGKITAISSIIPSHVSKFETILKLEDGELFDTNSRWLTTKGCTLTNGMIRCQLKEVVS